MKAVLIVLVGAVVFVSASSALGAVITYEPSDRDIGDLDHGRYYTWGIQKTWSDTEEVLSAELFIDNIRNWKWESNDLWIQLLDGAPLGLRTYTDNQASSNAFSGQGVELAHYEDLPPIAQDLTIIFNPAQIASLETFVLNDGIFALGFDPDCHFYNDGVALKITTGEVPHTVPEPATVTLLALGGIGALLRRRRARA